MKSVFKYLNIELSDLQSNGENTSFLVINNTDGTPRWICNSNSKKPLFLKFYSVSSLKSRLFATAIKMIFFFRFHKLLFQNQKFSISKIDDNLGTIVDFSNNNWAIFTGTVGPNNKILIYEEGSKENYFYKLAHSPKAFTLIKGEETALKKIKSFNPTSFIYPKSEIIGNVLKMEDLSFLKTRCPYLSNLHQDALSEIYKNSIVSLEFNSLPIFEEVKEKLLKIEKSSDLRLPKGLIRKLRLLFDDVENQIIDAAFCHGDFTPWNMYANNEKIAIYDWELSSPLMPIGFDAFHFIMQQGILVSRTPWKDIHKEIKNRISTELLSKWSLLSKKSVNDYLKIYLLINTVSYLHLYAEQTKWHMQVFWLLDTWGQALSDSVQEKKSNRELMIMDLFDFLHQKEYVAIKFPNSLPDELSEYSDIDLAIEKSDLKPILHFVENHPFVISIHSIKKSFMDSVQIILSDYSLLSLDLIWKFKQKSLVMLDVSKIIENGFQNEFGVKLLNEIDLQRYIGVFYGLNHAKIPAKYQTSSLLVNSNKPLDKILNRYYLDGKSPRKELVKVLKKEKQNRFLKRFSNLFNYYLDSFKQIIKSKGMIITFSGVDGAGKSTVIENVKHVIEKKLRKPVVVIRHRPSLLPILSAWTKGKAKAEQDAANTLPRQGGNKSSVSSFLRFAYYYSDYVFGQFYVKLKHVTKGKIVLYDRYYFDFINDSRRSNIQLSKTISNAGYKLLLKPDLNFFLYADPATILARKQELDRETIISLTEDYLMLFEKLDEKSKNRYFPIKNIILEDTVEKIISEVKKKLV